VFSFKLLNSMAQQQRQQDARQAPQRKAENPGQFADLDKAARDVFSEQYHDHTKFETTIKALPTLEVNSHLCHNRDNNSLKGTVVPKFTHESGLVLKATVDTTQYVKVDASLTPKGLPGLKLNAVAENNSKGKVTLDYKYDIAACSSTVSACGPSGPFCIESSLALAPHVNVVVGSSVAVSGVGQENDLKSIKGALYYKNDSSTIGLVLDSTSGSLPGNRGLSAYASLYHKLNPFSTVAMTVNHDLKGEAATRVALGGVHKLNSDLTVRSKFDSTGLLAAAANQRLNLTTEICLSAQTNVTRGFTSAKDNKFGCHINYKN
jgi:hypothetical protein